MINIYVGDKILISSRDTENTIICTELDKSSSLRAIMEYFTDNPISYNEMLRICSASREISEDDIAQALISLYPSIRITVLSYDILIAKVYVDKTCFFDNLVTLDLVGDTVLISGYLEDRYVISNLKVKLDDINLYLKLALLVKKFNPDGLINCLCISKGLAKNVKDAVRGIPGCDLLRFKEFEGELLEYYDKEVVGHKEGLLKVSDITDEEEVESTRVAVNYSNRILRRRKFVIGFMCVSIVLSVVIKLFSSIVDRTFESKYSEATSKLEEYAKVNSEMILETDKKKQLFEKFQEYEYNQTNYEESSLTMVDSLVKAIRKFPEIKLSVEDEKVIVEAIVDSDTALELKEVVSSIIVDEYSIVKYKQSVTKVVDGKEKYVMEWNTSKEVE